MIDCSPFSLHIPNAGTIAFIEATERGEGKPYTSLEGGRGVLADGITSKNGLLPTQ